MSLLTLRRPTVLARPWALVLLGVSLATASPQASAQVVIQERVVVETGKAVDVAEAGDPSGLSADSTTNPSYTVESDGLFYVELSYNMYRVTMMLHGQPINSSTRLEFLIIRGDSSWAEVVNLEPTVVEEYVGSSCPDGPYCSYAYNMEAAVEVGEVKRGDVVTPVLMTGSGTRIYHYDYYNDPYPTNDSYVYEIPAPNWNPRYTGFFNLGRNEVFAGGAFIHSVYVHGESGHRIEYLGVLHERDFTFEVTVAPDTVRTSGVADIGVVAVDTTGAETRIDPNTPVSVRVEAGGEGEWGRIALITDQDTLDVGGLVKYGDVQSGRLIFVADGTVPDTTATASLIAEVPKQPVTRGSAEFTFEPDQPSVGLDVSVSSDVLVPGTTAVVSVESSDSDVPLSDSDRVDLALEGVAATVAEFHYGSEVGTEVLAVPVSDLRAGAVTLMTRSTGTPPAALLSGEPAGRPMKRNTESSGAASLPSHAPDLETVLTGIPADVTASLTDDPDRSGRATPTVVPLALGFTVTDAGGAPLAPGAEIGPDEVVRGVVEVYRVAFGPYNPIDGVPAGDYPAVPSGIDNTALIVCATHADPNGSDEVGIVEAYADEVGAAFTSRYLQGSTEIGKCAFLNVQSAEGVITYNDFPTAGTGRMSYPVELPSSLFPGGTQAGVQIVGGLVGWADGNDRSSWLSTRSGQKLNASVPLVLKNPGEPTVELTVVETADFEATSRTWHISAGTGSTGPRMPNVQVVAELLDLPDGPVELNWTFETTYALPNSRCSGGRKGHIVITEREVVEGSDEAYWSVPFDAESASLSIKGVGGAGGTTAGCSYEFTSWAEANGWAGPYRELDPSVDETSSPFVGTGAFTGRVSNDLWTGGAVRVTVDVGDAGASELSDTVNSLFIRGRNPTPNAIQTWVGRVLSDYAGSELGSANVVGNTDLAREVFTFFKHESAGRQFLGSAGPRTCIGSGNAGIPCWGGPNGYGLAQLDFPPVTERQLWNWASNAEGGATLWLKYRKLFLSRVRSSGVLARSSVGVRDIDGTLTSVHIQEFVFKGTYAIYNGGPGFNYWVPTGAPGVWARTTSSRSSDERADDAWSLF